MPATHSARLLTLATTLAVVAFAGCRDRSQSPGEPGVLRLGYLPNLTHGQALTGVASGRYAAALPGISLETAVFGSGPQLVEALFAGEVDIAYLGPSPAMNAFVRSDGRALQLLAGSATGGSRFVVRRDSGISAPPDLRGKRIGVPQIGNTQDVAMRAWLVTQGLGSADRGGDVAVFPLANADILGLVQRKELDGAWVPEPWAARLIAEADCHTLLDESVESPQRPVTVLAARRAFAAAQPDLVRAFVAAHRSETTWHQTHPDAARQAVGDAVFELVGKRLPSPVLADAFAHVVPTAELHLDELQRLARAAFDIGYLPKAEISGMVLTP